MRHYLPCSLFLSVTLLLVRGAAAAAISPYNEFSSSNVSVEALITYDGKTILSGSPKTAETLQQKEDLSVRTVSVKKTIVPDVECYFVYRETKNPWAQKATPSGNAGADGTLTYEATTELDVAAPPKPGKGAAKVTIQKPRESGTYIVGWLVRAISNGQIVGVAASNDTYLDWAKNPDLLDSSISNGDDDDRGGGKAKPTPLRTPDPRAKTEATPKPPAIPNFATPRPPKIAPPPKVASTPAD